MIWPVCSSELLLSGNSGGFRNWKPGRVQNWSLLASHICQQQANMGHPAGYGIFAG